MSATSNAVIVFASVRNLIYHVDTNPELVDLQETLYTSRNPTRRWLHCLRRDWIIDALKRHAVGSNALEVGPGSGLYLPVLADLFANVLATDIDTTYLENAKRRFSHNENISLMTDDITNSALVEAQFDLILCIEVIEHIGDSQAAITEMHRLLKPGGILLLSTPQVYSPLELAAKIAFLPGIIEIVRLVYREAIIETGHINLMSEKVVTDQLTAAGFIVREQFQSGFYLPLIAEFGGKTGQQLLQWFENKLREGPGRHLLWTQYYVASA